MASSTATESAVSKQPVLGDVKPLNPQPKQDFIVRRMRLRDVPTLAEANRQAYWLSPMNNFLAPRAIKHPEQMTRIFRQSICRKYCNPNSLSIVACAKENPDVPVGYAQFARLGNDTWAKEKGLIVLIYLYILSWVFWTYDKLDFWFVPDRISDFKAQKTLESWFAQDAAKYWTPYPERSDRWHVNSVIVPPSWQGKGIGRLLMREVLVRAQNERVVCGLTASTHGEFLYRKLGFDYLGDFTNRLETEEGDEGGGNMCWFPEGWEGRRVE